MPKWKSLDENYLRIPETPRRLRIKTIRWRFESAKRKNILIKEFVRFHEEVEQFKR